MNAYGKRAAVLHLSYVERDGVEQDGGAGSLYGPAEVSDVRGALSAPMEDEKRQFRFIVSPEDAGDVDLTAFTRRLMAQVQADLGRVLVWGAVNHWNTDNPHVHVIVRGIDEAGHDVTIDGRYLAEGMRSRAQTILTNELGPRTEVDIQNQLAREVREERFTSLDRVLQSCEQRGGMVLEARLPRDGRASRVRLTARLGRLELLGLAVRTSSLAWQLREGWVDTLRGLGQANDIVKRMHAAVPGADPSRLVVVDESSTRPPVDGVVRAKGGRRRCRPRCPERGRPAADPVAPSCAAACRAGRSATRTGPAAACGPIGLAGTRPRRATRSPGRPVARAARFPARAARRGPDARACYCWSGSAPVLLPASPHRACAGRSIRGRH